MKIAVFTLAVVLPYLYVCTALPDYSATFGTNSDVKVQNTGKRTNVSASSGACASVADNGNKYGKCDVEGFEKYMILVRNQGDLEKIAKPWMVWKSSSLANVDIQEKLCLPRYMVAEGCHSTMLKISVQSETNILYETWGRHQEKVIYTKQKLSISSENFHIYTTNVLAVTELQNGSQEVVNVKNEQTIREIFDNNPIAIVDSDFETYMVITSKGENGSTFIVVSQEVYESVEMKQQLSQRVDKVLQTNNLSSKTFVEVTNIFDIDITQYQWDKSGGTDVAKGNAGDSDGSCTGNTGKPDVQEFMNYSVLKLSFEEFKSKINKITWHLSKYTPSSEEVTTDVTVCADRYIQNSSSCKAVKFQYVTENGKFVFKEWGLEENLIFIQEKITASSQQYVILKAEVDTVMKATRDSNVAVSVNDKSQVQNYLSSDYAILATDFKNYIIGQTSCEKGSITFIAFIEDIYLCEESQQKFAEEISQVLKVNGIDESKLMKLTQKFDVDTNKYNNQNNAEPCNKIPSTTQSAATPAVPPATASYG